MAEDSRVSARRGVGRGGGCSAENCAGRDVGVGDVLDGENGTGCGAGGGDR